MNSQSSIWLALGVAALLGLVILLLGGSPQPTETVAVSRTPTSSTGSAAGRVSSVQRGMAAPIVEVGDDIVVGERTAVRLEATAFDPGGGPVTVLWTAEGGLGFFQDVHSPITTYTAPSACDCEDTVKLTLTATTAAGVSSTDSLYVVVRDPLACPTMTYDTSGSWVTTPVDPCRVEATTSCPAEPSLPCDSPCVTEAVSETCFEVPVPCPCEQDCGGTWDTNWPLDPTLTPLHPRDRPKPLIDRQYPERIAEGSAIQLHGRILNPACQPVCFVWSASKGWIEGGDTLDPIYRAPESERAGGESVTITLTVYDRSGGRSYDQIRCRIDNLDDRTPGR